MNAAQSWFNAALAFLYPEVCQLCRERNAGPGEGFVCSHCWQQVRFVKPPFCERCGLPFEGDITNMFDCTNCRGMNLHFKWARAAVHARGLVLDVIHRYKYNRELWYETFLVDLLLRQARPDLDPAEWDYVVPVPLHPTRERERQFNQARRIAIQFSRTMSLPLQDRWLKRTRQTQTQTRLTRQERTRNMAKAFTFRHHRRLEGERCILVDDVFTTGATTNACAKVLTEAGAGAVCVWTVARGI